MKTKDYEQCLNDGEKFKDFIKKIVAVPKKKIDEEIERQKKEKEKKRK